MFIESSALFSYDKASRDANEVMDYFDFQSSGYFSCPTKCSSSSCESSGFAVGNFTETIEQADYDNCETIRKYRLDWITPAPHLFAVPERTTAPIRESILCAFAIFWSDAPSCVGNLRVAVERIMDHLRAPKTKMNKDGKRKRRTLHDRIECIKDSDPQLCGRLLAAKWIGNDGAHDRQTTRSDAVDAMRLLESALRHLFDQSDDEIDALARQINKSKKPASRSTRRKAAIKAT